MECFPLSLAKWFLPLRNERKETGVSPLLQKPTGYLDILTIVPFPY
ncbi:Hypothetical protein DEACI_1426 [Acididesulfobacillus acetoxydans]|uniref:Uncharacterized protein n=1 Tax=Acididesulfobacillus acetoxydans TaxID=1561005 RepID=A0A8S0VWE4_9FIRM|nr:Hypothetical protein DEACI_1426 [Acididesulfobacillus acetoxydans]CEJ08621.1 Hypothetical protein DEACI_3100 [Acididesulfobacillus acetoxydans]